MKYLFCYLVYYRFWFLVSCHLINLRLVLVLLIESLCMIIFGDKEESELFDVFEDDSIQKKKN